MRPNGIRTWMVGPIEQGDDDLGWDLDDFRACM